MKRGAKSAGIVASLALACAGLGWVGCAGEEPILPTGASPGDGGGGDASDPSTPAGCVGDACVPATCASGQTLCGTACVDVASDPANCGACGVACATGEVCKDARCEPSPCAANEHLAADGKTCVACKKSAVLDDAPVHYWRFGETSMSDPAVDLGSVKQNGTYFGTAANFTLGAPTMAGDGDTGVSMKGQDITRGVRWSSVTMPGAAGSIEVWMKAAPSDKTLCLFTYATNDEDNGLSLSTEAEDRDGANSFAMSNVFWYFSPPLDDGTWKMVVWTWDQAAKTSAVYIDGTKVFESVPTSVLTTGRLYVGQEQDQHADEPVNGLDPDQAFIGELDDLAVFDKALTPAQITAHYHGYLCK